MTKPDFLQPDGSGPGDPFVPLPPDVGPFHPQPDLMPAEFPTQEPSTQE